VKQLFGTHGDIVEVRLVRDRNGRSKGFAYVQFKASESIAGALSMDKSMVANRPIKVQQSKASAKVESEKSAGGTTLFGYNFPLSFTEKDAQEIFGKHGEIAQVQIGKKGRANGFIYIEFKEKEGLDAALSLDGTVLNGKTINCRRSKNTVTGEKIVPDAPKPVPAKSLGGGAPKKDPAAPRRSMVMVPRAMQRGKPNPGAKSATAATKTNATAPTEGAATTTEDAATTSVEPTSDIKKVSDEPGFKAKSQDEFRRLMMAGKKKK